MDTFHTVPFIRIRSHRLLLAKKKSMAQDFFHENLQCFKKCYQTSKTFTCSKSTIKVLKKDIYGVVLVSLLLTSNIFYIFS